MYDRRIDGEEHTFGNEGALYKNAMTWYDHQTDSVWSQVTGRALFGPLEGTVLEQIPASVEPWGAWRTAHPETLVLETPRGFSGEFERDDFVIGVRVGEEAVAFDYSFVVGRGVVNDAVAGIPVAVYANADRVIRVFSRQVGGSVVSLSLREGRLVDRETASSWDPSSGQGLSGPLAEEELAPLPWASSFDWAWLDFYPQARIVRE